MTKKYTMRYKKIIKNLAQKVWSLLMIYIYLVLPKRLHSTFMHIIKITTA